MRDKDFMKELQEKREHLKFLVEHKSAKNFKSTIITFKKNLKDYETFLKEHYKKLGDINYVKPLLHDQENDQLQAIKKMEQSLTLEVSKTSEELNNRIYKLYVTSQICRVFFLIGAYLLFKKKENGIDSEVYIKELWSHTNPDDADGINLNRPPITSNPFWLTYLRLYGGSGNDFWANLLRFGDFHGASKYIDQYYLLAVEKEKTNLRAPPKVNLDKMKMNKRYYELDHWFSFSTNFSSLIGTKNLVDRCDNLIEEASTFNRLLSTKSKNEKGEIHEIDAKKKLEDLKEWIRNKAKEFEETKKEIIKLLPLDPKRIEKCKGEISRAYGEKTEIHKVSQVIESVQERDKALKFKQIYNHIQVPRDCLTEPSTTDCSIIWSDLGRSIAFGELNYFIEKVKKRRAIERIKIKDVDIKEIFYKIETIVKDLKEEGLTPSTIFIPLKYWTDIRIQNRLVYEEDTFFKVGEEEKLKIIGSSNFIPFNDIIILDKKSSIWTHKVGQFSSNRLDITIKENEKDNSKVNVLVRTIINLNIENPKGLKVLKIKRLKNGKK